MTRILVADDEKHIVDLVRLYLEKEGFQVDAVYDGAEVEEKIEALRPHLLVLDLMLPHVSGLEICRRIRKTSDLPILMLTARADAVDKIVGLELGADDYLTKPFNPRELVARVRAILRRYEAAVTTHALRVGDLEIDADRREATINGEPVNLRGKEFDLLTAFARSPGIVLSRDRLLELAWGYDYVGETRTVDVHVAQLREKLAPSKVVLETIRGVGYKLSPPPTRSN